VPTGFIKFANNFLVRIEASLVFVGTLPKRFELVKRFVAELDLAGSLQRYMSLTQTSTIGFVGALRRSLSHRLTATLSFAGNLRRLATRALAASVGLSGSLTRSIILKLQAALRPAGGLQQGITRRLSAALSVSGKTSVKIYHALVASITLSGGFFKEAVVQRLTASLAFAGRVSRTTAHRFQAALNFRIHIPFRRLVHFFTGPDRLISKIPTPTLTLVAFQRQAVVPDELVRQEPSAIITELSPGTFEDDLPLPPYARVHGEAGLEERTLPPSVESELPDHRLTLVETANELILEERDLAED
jgi:hypothetical protein